MSKWVVVSRTSAWLTRQNVISELCFQQLAKKLVFLANDDIFEWRTQDVECSLKQIGITQTLEGCFLGNLSIIVVLRAVIPCVVNFHVFIIVASVGLVWKDLATADNAGLRWPQLSPGLGMYFLSIHQYPQLEKL